MLRSFTFNFANFFAGFTASYKGRFYIHSFDKSFLNLEVIANNIQHTESSIIANF